MGRIKSTLIKRTAKKLVDEEEELFSQNFEHNKKVLGRTMPSKKLRNKIAGQIVVIKKKRSEEEKKLKV